MIPTVDHLVTEDEWSQYVLIDTILTVNRAIAAISGAE